MKKILFIILLSLFITPLANAEVCSVTEVRFNYKTKKIYEASTKHTYRVFKILKNAQKFAKENNIEENVFTDKKENNYKVFITVPKGSCIRISETN